jgi:aldose 1-epimerase
MPIPVSGHQYSLRAGRYRAEIASVGATLRSLTIDGRDLVVPFDADELRPFSRGVTLAPWPNRIVDGQYSFAGVDLQLPLTEPNRAHALHGLVSWAEFSAVEQSESRVLLESIVEPQMGYPFRIRVSVEFALTADGLTNTVSGENLGPTAAPWGAGPHPYLVAGPGRVDDWQLELPAEEVLTVTPERLIPIGLAPVATEAHGAFDFRTARGIGDTFIDHAFTTIARDEAGIATVRVLTQDGGGVSMSWDLACPWVQVHTADQPDPTVNRAGLAVEPMTCPPDAFNSGTDVIVLEPGESTSASWTIAAI